MITAFLQLFGKLLLWIYNWCHSYALALILFTLLTKLVLFPVSYKGKKSMMQTTALQNELQKLQKQYGKDRERLNEETQKLYEREGVNPMGGCLWSFLPLPILMGLYAIIRRPMLYMMMLTDDEIQAAIAAVDKLGIDMGASVAYKEMTIAGLMHSDQNVWNAVANAVGDSASKLVDINFTSFGINMAQIPTWKVWTLHMNWSDIGLFLIPLIVVVVSYGYSIVSQKTNKITMGSKEDDNSAAAQTTKQMMIMMPLMYLWFGYIMPAGMCVYMMFNSVFMAIQEVLCAWMLRGKFAEMKAETERRAAIAKEEEKQRKAEIAARRAEEAEKMKTKKGRQQAKSEKKKSKDRPNEYTRVGVRAYARGRAYDPDRYPSFPYRDPQDVLDEAALEAALGKKGKKLAQEEPEVLPEVVETVEAIEAAPVAEETVEAAAPQTADEVFESIQEELK